MNSDGTVKSSTKIASDTNGGPMLLEVRILVVPWRPWGTSTEMA